MSTQDIASLVEAEEAASLWNDAWLRLKKNRAAVTGGVTIAHGGVGGVGDREVEVVAEPRAGVGGRGAAEGVAGPGGEGGVAGLVSRLLHGSYARCGV